MRELFHDFMAIVRVKGNPDFFITITCNSRWQEILDELLPGQEPWMRPGLINRVFQQKLKILMADLFETGVLGMAVAKIYVIEFQKRGLPHAHILIFLHPDDKARSGEQVDTFISAEVPDPDLNKELHELVKKHMIHTPCDQQDPAYDSSKHHSCVNSRGECKKRFPFRFQEESNIPPNTFAQVKRTPKEKGGHVFIWKKSDGEEVEIDARWVVKYNPKLLLKYDCHLNVEYSGCQKTVKYICGYIGKGHDMSCFKLSDFDDNEIEYFKNARFIGPLEAHWNISGFTKYHNKPSVARLALHLEDKQSIMFEDTSEIEPERLQFLKRTTLTAYFEINGSDQQRTKDPPVQDVLYGNFPTHFTWDTTKRCWKRRSQREQVGRIRPANFRDTERWCLRKLLLRVSGATSYEHLRTVPKAEDINFMFEDQAGSSEAEFMGDSIDGDQVNIVQYILTFRTLVTA